MPDRQRAQQRIEAAIPGARAEVSTSTGGGDHSEATVVSAGLRRLSRIEQHRIVYEGRWGGRRRDSCARAQRARKHQRAEQVSKNDFPEVPMAQPAPAPEAAPGSDPRRDPGDRRAPGDPVHEGHPRPPACGFSARTVGDPEVARHSVRRRRHPARPADPPGALRDLRMADDPAAVHRWRARRRLRHRHRDVRVRRAPVRARG